MFDTDCIENASSDVLLEAKFIVQLPSNKLFTIVARIRAYENVHRVAA
jgi:hypothetical protein